MHDRQWMRVGLAVVLVGAALGGVTTAGCSGDDNGPAATGGKDAAPDNTTQQDSGSGGPDSSAGEGDADAAAPGHAHVYVVHASETAPPLRFCFGLATQADGGSVTVLSTFTALPDTVQSAQQPFPGLFPGTGGLLDDHGFDLSVLNVAAFAIDATKLTGDIGGDGSTERTCDKLVGADGLGSGGAGGGQLKLGTDFWSLGIIAHGTLLPGTSWVFAITGCPAGVMDAAEQAFCGPAYDPVKGNLGFAPFRLDSKTVPMTGTMGAQFAQASYQWDVVRGQLDAGLITGAGFYEPAAPPDAGPPGDGGSDGSVEAAGDDGGGTGDATAEAGDDGGSTGDATAEAGADASTGDAGDDGTTAEAGGDGGDGGHKGIMAPPQLRQVPLAVGVNFGDIKPMTSQSISGLTFDGTSGFAATYVSGISPFGQPVALPLTLIQALTYGSPTGGVAFANGQSFVFVLVGNPLLPPFVDPVDGGAVVTPDGGTPGQCLLDPVNPCTYNLRAAHFLAFPALN